MDKFSYEGEYQYARSRLENTLVMHGGRVRRVENINTVNGDCLLRVPMTGRTYVAHVDELVVNDYNLGYVNFTKNSGYIVRIPKKQYKQGVREDTLYDNLNNHWVESIDTPIINMMSNFYPSIQSCMTQVDCGEANSRAFNRSFSLANKQFGGGFELSYKKKPVGVIFMSDAGQPGFELYDNYKWLEETVGEAI